MDKITNTKTEFRLKQWSNIIQACQTSGMTVASWCSQNNVNIKSYYYWLRKVRNLACEAKSFEPQKTEHNIVPVPFHQTKDYVAVTIHLSSFCININEGASRETIEAVLSALKSIC